LLARRLPSTSSDSILALDAGAAALEADNELDRDVIDRDELDLLRTLLGSSHDTVGAGNAGSAVVVVDL